MKASRYLVDSLVPVVCLLGLVVMLTAQAPSIALGQETEAANVAEEAAEATVEAAADSSDAADDSATEPESEAPSTEDNPASEEADEEPAPEQETSAEGADSEDEATAEAPAESATDEQTTGDQTTDGQATDGDSAESDTAESDSAADQATDETSFNWQALLITIAVLVLPIVIGNYLAKNLRLPEQAWKISTILLVIAVGAVTVFTGQFKGGPDLAGGITLVYELESQEICRCPTTRARGRTKRERS